MDVNITARVVLHLLQYEIKQSGLNLTHTQDRNYIQVLNLMNIHHYHLININQNLVNALGHTLQPKYKEFWDTLHLESGSSVDLMLYMEEYAHTLAKNMPQIFTQPFDVVHDNLGIYQRNIPLQTTT